MSPLGLDLNNELKQLSPKATTNIDSGEMTYSAYESGVEVDTDQFVGGAMYTDRQKMAFCPRAT